MKKKIQSITLALLAGSAASLSGQEMIAGWDFSPFAFDNFSSVNGTSTQGFVNANFAGNGDLIADAEFTKAAGLGTMYYDGNFGSTALSLDPSDVEPSGSRDADLTAGNGTIGSSGAIATLEAQGQQFGNAKAFGFNNGANGDAVTFGFDLSGGTLANGTQARDWGLRFAGFVAGMTDNAATIDWSYSTDGSTFVSSGLSTSLDQNESEKLVDFSGISALDGVSQAFFRANLSGIEDGNAYIDNFQGTGTVVPEPSAFAAIFGTLALGFAAVRRRRQA